MSPNNTPIDEIWKPLIGCEHTYSVSNLGNIKNIKTGKLKKPSKTNCGYLYVSIIKDGKHYSKKVHSLVASTFIRPPLPEETVNHIDLNKENNRADNLEYITRQENVAHAWINGAFGATTEIRQQVIAKYEKQGSHKNIKDIAKELDITTSVVHSILFKKGTPGKYNAVGVYSLKRNGRHLKEETIDGIERDLLNKDLKQVEIAAKYGVNKSTITRIKQSMQGIRRR